MTATRFAPKWERPIAEVTPPKSSVESGVDGGGIRVRQEFRRGERADSLWRYGRIGEQTKPESEMAPTTR